MIVHNKITTSTDEDAGSRTKLRDELWEATEKVIDAHPELRLVFSILWTPRPDDHPRGVPYDDSHTSIMTGNTEVPVEQLEKFLSMALEQVVGLYARVVRRDPELIDKLSKRK